MSVSPNNPTATTAATAPALDMRALMPVTYQTVLKRRELFGVDVVNGHIKAGMRGQAGRFYACEAGHTVGTPTAAFAGWVAALSGLSGWMTACEWAEDVCEPKTAAALSDECFDFLRQRLPAVVGVGSAKFVKKAFKTKRG